MDKLFSWAKKPAKKDTMAENKQSYPAQQPYPTQQPQNPAYPYQQPHNLAYPYQQPQNPSYPYQQPQNPMYPYQQTQNPGYPHHQPAHQSLFPGQPFDAMQGMPPPPPSYDESMHHSVANQSYPSSPPMYQNNAHSLPGPEPVKYVSQPAPTATFIPNAFHAGARFGKGSPARIPPPPPGVAPNAAQFAEAMGQNVVLGQKPPKFF